jgi:hypothetical protein
LVLNQLRYFLVVALLTKKARDRLARSLPYLPAPIHPCKSYAQVDTSDLGGIWIELLS